MSRPRALLFWLALALPVAFFTGQALAPEASLYTQPVLLYWMGAVPKLAFGALAVLVGIFVTSRFEPDNPSRLAWWLWTAGCLGTWVGQAILAVYFATRGEIAVFPSVADPFFVAGSLALAASLFAFVRVTIRSGFTPLNATHRWVIGLGAAVLSTLLVLPVLWPVLETSAPALEKFLLLAYPALDLLMLVPALLLLRLTASLWGGRVWTVWALLAGGILCNAAGDILFSYFSGLGKTQLEALIDIAFLLGYGLFAAGVIHQRDLLAG
ncbi:MAG TPA: hypothetical protein DD490_13205 [Acidobacteria bacterium]|nr:hypothetical protein [Acidobacteriota bacterium]